MNCNYFVQRSQCRAWAGLCALWLSGAAWGGESLYQQSGSFLRSAQGIPWRLSGATSLNWRNVGPREPGFETQIQNEVFFADTYFAFLGPALDGVPFRMEFQMPVGSQGQPNLYQFFFQYKRLDNWDFYFGKFLVPFGRYNELYRPDMFLTVTRPLLYSSPDSLDLVVRINSPRPPVSSGYADIGARISYYPSWKALAVPSEMTFFVVNGLSEATNRLRTFPRPNNLGITPPPPNGVSVDFGHENNNLADNNNNKAIGGRIVYSFGNLDLPWPIPEGKRDLDGVGLGFSAMGGQFDLEAVNNYHMVGADITCEYLGINLSAEYMYSFTHFQSPLEANGSSNTLATPNVLVRDFEDIYGYFVQASYPIWRKPRWGKRVTGIVVYNQMWRRGPQLDLFTDQTVNGTFFASIAAYNNRAPRIDTRIDKITFAVNWQVTDHVILKYDYSFWGLQRASTLFTTDIYQGALSIVGSF